MKIEEILNEMWRTPVEAVDEASMVSWIKAIEQHHKDLMGLVEAWKAIRHPNSFDPIGATYEQCAEELESLINPKD